MKQKGRQAVLDPFSLIAIIAALIYCYRNGTFADTNPDLALKSELMVGMILGALVLGFGLKLIRFDFTLTPREIQKIMRLTLVGVGITLSFQMLIAQASNQLSILNLTDRVMFYMSAAIAEEAFFRMLLLTLALRFFNNRYATVGVSVGVSALFLFFHQAMYGFADVFLSMILFVSSIIFSILFLNSQDSKGNLRVMVPMGTHALCNFIAEVIKIA